MESGNHLYILILDWTLLITSKNSDFRQNCILLEIWIQIHIELTGGIFLYLEKIDINAYIIMIIEFKIGVSELND